MPGKKTFSVVEAAPGCFYVCTYENRKRVYVHPDQKADTKCFPTRAKAERAAKKLSTAANAQDFRALSPLQRREYWELAGMARDHGLSIREAVENGCGKSSNWPERIHTHIDPFLLDRSEKRQLKRSSLNFYRDKLRVLFRDYPRATFGDFPPHRLKTLIQSFENGYEWETGAVRAISAFWNWGAKLHPPIAPYGITRSISLDHPKRAREIDFLTVEEAARFLDATHIQYNRKLSRPGKPVYDRASGPRWSREAFALMFFTGMRKSEAEGMEWEFVNFDERQIWIPDKISKTEGGRLIEHAPPVLWDWIRPEHARHRFVCSHQLRDERTFCGARSGIPFWPQSGIRHSLATYHYAAHKDAKSTRELLGHDEDALTMEQRYRGVSTERAGKLYLPTQARGLAYLSLTPQRCAEIAAA